MVKKVIVALIIVALAAGLGLQTYFRIESDKQVQELTQLAAAQEHNAATINYMQPEFEYAVLCEDTAVYTYPFEKEIRTLTAGTVLEVIRYGAAHVAGTEEDGAWFLVSFANPKSPSDNLGWVQAELVTEYTEN